MVAALALVTVGCAKPSQGINSFSRQTERTIEVALDQGRVEDALRDALDYERRVPGPSAWSLLGRALWRQGDLDTAESFHRRSARDGHPEGRLGLARALAARGQLMDALDLAGPTVEVDSIAVRAGRFVGSLHWRTGDWAAAADTFARAAAAAENRSVRQMEALAAAAGEMAAAGGPDWNGAAGPVATVLAAGATVATVQVGGIEARLLVDPMNWQSSLTDEFARRAGLGGDRAVAVVDLAIGEVTGRVPFEISSVDRSNLDGVLAFDLLADLRWRWTPSTATLFVGAAGKRDEDRYFQRDLAATHWVSSRTPIDGLAMQLLLVPRVGDQPEVAMMTRAGATTISVAAARRADPDTAGEVGDAAALRTRLGGWQDTVSYRITPPLGSMGSLPIVAEVVLGAGFVERWTWRWSPDTRQLALIEHDFAGAGSAR